ncbi:MAG: cyclic nucleotide-binding domain-containing protein, partial [Anaerolineae bacterium]|nr:cyclic nucleotide-binding domain-containing protein [Anaerolineae bacterium]
MTDRFIEQYARQLPLFAPLPPDLFQQTLSAMEIIQHEAGETVFHQGETSKGMYMLINGRADLIRKDNDGNDVRVGRLEQNQFINEKALYQKGRETATLVVRVTSSFLVIYRNRLWDVVANYPQIKSYIPVPVEPKPQKPKPTAPSTPTTVQQPRPQPTHTPVQSASQPTERAEFDGQRKNETVLLKTRRHWWSFIQKAWFPAMLFGTGLMVWAFVPIPIVQIIACGFVGLFVPAVLMLYHFVEWRNDMLIITNQRVVYIERKLFALSYNKTEIVLARIHQVNIEINPRDPMARLFRYGSIELRTAGDSGNIVLHTIQNVDDVQDVIFENRAKLPDDGTSNDRSQIRNDIERVLAGEDISESDGKRQTITPPQKIFAPLRSKFMNTDGDTVYRRHAVVWWRNMIRPALLIIGAFAVLIFGATWGLGAFSGIIGIALFFGAMLWAWWTDW